MKKYETHYPVEGSAALKSDCLDNIIEFPGQHAIQHEDMYALDSETQRKTSFFQSLKNGSIQGKSFGLAKPWQSWLIGACFLTFALACVFLGNV